MSGLPPVASSHPEPIPATRIHLSDVEFRGEIIYFLVLDRFCRGGQKPVPSTELDDPERKEWGKYWGGNLQGVLDRLDYLREMGVTAIWVTPLFEQVEAMENGKSAPMHGYWTRDFKRINARWVNDPSEVRLFARNDTVFDRLLEEMHRRNMKFILDVVCNHSSPETPEGKGRIYDDGRLVADFNDDKENWYHHYGTVTNWEDEWQIQNCELAGLATFNENNVLYRRYIKDAMKLWLDKGVDALRIDTVKHMPIWFWQEFNADLQTHKPDVFIFGEWIHSHPKNPTSVKFANQGGMSLLDFGLCNAVRQCLGENAEAGFYLVHEIFEEDSQYRGASELVTFFENHDMPRLQSLNDSVESVHLAMALVLTCRGIPCLYYGCEQYLHHDSEQGNDPYNRPMMERWDETEARRILRILSQERQENLAIQWGGHWLQHVDPDLYAYLRRYGNARCLVVLNRGGEREITLSSLDLPEGKHRCLLTGQEIEVQEGRAAVPVPGRSALIFSVRTPSVMAKSLVHVQINGAPTQPGETLAVIGDCPELGAWDLRGARVLECVNRNTWFGELAFEESTGKPVAYKYVIFSSEKDAAPRRELRIVRRRSIAEQGMAKWRDVWEE
jgi:cyclomaltodextrin glucanotransferase